MMKVRTKYIIFIVLIHMVALVLSYFIFSENKLLFIFSEGIIIISILLSIQLYQKLLQPLKILMTGIEAMKSMDFNVKFRKTGEHEMDQLIEVYNKMSDQLRIERTQQQRQHFFLEKLIFTSPTGILILDYDNRVEQVNPKALSLLNIAEDKIRGYNIDKVEHPLLQQIGHLKSGESITVSISGADTYKLQMAHFIDKGFPRNFIVIEELTAEILAAEKKVYEKVIRMMAHEVNNTIGPVNSIINSTLNSKPLWASVNNPTLYEALEVAIDRNNNLNGFMRNLADLVKLPLPVKKHMETDRLVRNVIHLMLPQAREKNIIFKYDGDKSISFSGDEQQMEQALINIVKNAIESIDINGVISFDIDPYSRQLKIIDSGKGIQQEISDKLFSPFATTKRDGQGIGLTLVREILSNHQLAFSLNTIKPGHTEFVIRF